VFGTIVQEFTSLLGRGLRYEFHEDPGIEKAKDESANMGKESHAPSRSISGIYR
jgi:hypothetical protein